MSTNHAELIEELSKITRSGIDIRMNPHWGYDSVSSYIQLEHGLLQDKKFAPTLAKMRETNRVVLVTYYQPGVHVGPRKHLSWDLCGALNDAIRDAREDARVHEEKQLVAEISTNLPADYVVISKQLLKTLEDRAQQGVAVSEGATVVTHTRLQRLESTEDILKEIASLIGVKPSPEDGRPDPPTVLQALKTLLEGRVSRREVNPHVVELYNSRSAANGEWTAEDVRNVIDSLWQTVRRGENDSESSHHMATRLLLELKEKP